MQKNVFTLQEIAAMTGLSVSGLRKAVRRGDLRVVRVTRRLLVPRRELERIGLLDKNPGGAAGER